MKTDITIQKQTLRISRELLTEIIIILCILLFTYAAVSKLTDIQKFTVQLGKSPMLHPIAGLVAWLAPVTELAIAALMIIPRTRLAGMYGFYFMMVAFTVYIMVIQNFSEHVPCSCGGVLEKLGWTEHLIFNSVFVGMAAFAAVSINRRQKENEKNNMKVYMVLSGLGLAATLLVAALFFSYEVPNSKPNGFDRHYIDTPIKKRQETALPDGEYYFAGSDAGNLYLAHYRRKLDLLTITMGTLKLNHQRLTIHDAEKYRFRNLRTRVMAPFFYLSDGTIPRTFRGRLTEGVARPFMPNRSFFIQQQPISATRFVNRLLLDSLTGQVLAAETSNGSLDIKKELLEKQLDGQFCVEGTLCYDVTSATLAYVYTYRNAFFTADTNLHAANRYHTIDTNSRVKFSVATVRSENQHTLSSPPFTVNRVSCADGGVLFVHAALRADNERRAAFRDQSVIDCYLLAGGHYLGSFYLPQKKIAQLQVYGNRLVALSGKQLVEYEIDRSTLLNDFLHVETGRQTEHL